MGEETQIDQNVEKERDFFAAEIKGIIAPACVGSQSPQRTRNGKPFRYGDGAMRSETKRAALRALAHPVIEEDEGGHGFDDRHGARDDARVVAAAANEFRRRTVDIHGLLRLENGRGRFERHAKDDLLAVADAALRAATAIRHGANAALARLKKIVVFAAAEARTGETAAQFETFRRGQREHRLREIGLESIEHRLAEPRGHAADAALDHAADRIALGAHGLDAL